MAKKLVIDLTHPVAAPRNECLPHAAMKLGKPLGGLEPPPALVNRLVIQEQSGNWVFYRLDESGGFVGDSWHADLEDALKQAGREFGAPEAGAWGRISRHGPRCGPYATGRVRCWE